MAGVGKPAAKCRIERAKARETGHDGNSREAGPGVEEAETDISSIIPPEVVPDESLAPHPSHCCSSREEGERLLGRWLTRSVGSLERGIGNVVCGLKLA